MELIEFQYMKLFGISYQELQDEPIDKLFMNLRIYAYLKDKEQAEAKHGS